MAELSKANKEKIEQLQLIEQNISALIAQKQQFQAQILETESALSELKTTKKAFKIIGNIMVQSTSYSLKKELSSKKEMLELRVKAIEKQEQNLRKKASDIQKEVLKGMEN
ncbi:prefoldin subunit [Candidatus Woesearchaeota archaeon]|nr:prefoldin subunit [Candidatus Woesearchaeota archaeon]